MESFVRRETSGRGVEETEVEKVVGSKEFSAAGVGVSKILF